MDKGRDDLVEVFRAVFNNDEMAVEDGMESRDVEGWDSLTHINLLVAIEKKFGVTFTTGEMSRLKQPGQNIGSLLALIEDKVRAK